MKTNFVSKDLIYKIISKTAVFLKNLALKLSNETTKNAVCFYINGFHVNDFEKICEGILKLRSH